MTGKLPFKIALAITAFAIFLILTLTAQNQQPLFWDHTLPRTVFFAGAAAMAAILGSMYLIWKKRPEESRRAVWIILCGGSFLLYDILIRTAAEIRIFETPLFPVSLFRFFEGSGMMLTPESGGFNDLAGIALTAAGAMLLTLCAKEFCRNCRWKHLLIITGTAVIFTKLFQFLCLSRSAGNRSDFCTVASAPVGTAARRSGKSGILRSGGDFRPSDGSIDTRNVSVCHHRIFSSISVLFPEKPENRDRAVGHFSYGWTAGGIESVCFREHRCAGFCFHCR